MCSSDLARVQAELARRAVPLAGIERPFTLKVADLYRAINEATVALGPEDGDPEARRMRNADRRLDCIRSYITGRVASFKQNPDPQVVDLGTVMHLILSEEINSLNQLVRRGR